MFWWCRVLDHYGLLDVVHAAGVSVGEPPAISSQMRRQRRHAGLSFQPLWAIPSAPMEAHESITALEVVLRDLIAKTLSDKLGADWIDQCGTPERVAGWRNSKD